ncbi:hypothetical protein [Nocardioides guangzhouensis]|uniref:hypothetical protein n=1 Tax=Nocardioides guangzhouensis TaxID=2497878 RepID=UPI001C375632|nr:hypothetical protein [Nocardioides guangzhouensis]
MTTDVAPRTAPTSGFRLSRRVRRAVLALHILCGVGWMGADVLLAILVVAGRTSGDGATVAAAYTAVRLVVPLAVPVLVGGMLVTGVLLGLGTKWGLVQWWWVFVKLLVGIVLTALVLVALVPGALSIPEGLTGTADQVRDAVGRAGEDLMFPPFVSFAALAFALVLSVYKPWSRTRWGRRR